MMEALKRFGEDIRSGRNIELYVLFLLAAVIAVLDVFSVVAPSVTNATILAVLAVLVYGRVQDRRRFDALAERGGIREIRKFYPDRLSLPPLGMTLSAARHEVFLVGFTLSHLIHTQRRTLEDIALRGCKVRLAAWTPPDEEPARTLLVKSVEELRGLADLEGFLSNAVRRLTHWYESLDEHARRNIEIRGYSSLPTSVVLFVDPDLPQGYVRVEHSTIYKAAPQDIPAFELGPSDAPGLYQVYKKQYSKLWDEAQPLLG